MSEICIEIEKSAEDDKDDFRYPTLCSMKVDVLPRSGQIYFSIGEDSYRMEMSDFQLISKIIL